MASIPEWLRWYKKPSYVDPKSFSNKLRRKAEERRDSSASPRTSIISTSSELSIPKDLTLDRILSNKTCGSKDGAKWQCLTKNVSGSPMSLYDFYMYLRHVEFSQENLEFYIWFKDYETRHNAIPKPKTKEMGTQTDIFTVDLKRTLYGGEQTESIDYEMCSLVESESFREFVTYVESLVLHKAANYPRPCCAVASQNESSCAPVPVAEQQQHELRQIISLFLSPGGSKELNIPPSMRKAVMANLVHSDSPDIFEKVAEHVYALLKDCSHRNFVRLGVNNGTFETLCVVTFMGILFSSLGFFVMLLLAFASPRIHESSRWRGLASIPFWFVGISFLLAGIRGSCFLLLLFSRRQELPWERVADETSVRTGGSGRHSIRGFAAKMMIFERKIRVKDVGLRRLQRRIVVQSVVGAVVGTTILEVAWLCLPVWRPL